MINTYGYMVVRNTPNKIPLHVVQVSSQVLSAFKVFVSAIDAIAYIDNIKDDLLHYYIDLRYDSDFRFEDNLVEAYQNAKELFTKHGSLYIAI